MIVMVEKDRLDEALEFINDIAGESLSWEGERAREILDRWDKEDFNDE